MFALLLVSACASDTPAWAVDVLSAVPTSTGITGTQTWHFFTERWGKAKEDDAFVCARVQTFTGEVTSPAAYEGCASCLFSYALTFTEFDSDCDEALATDAAYVLPETLAIGDVPEDLVDLDPHPGRSLGWYAVFEGVQLEPYGFAWDDALDWGGDPGPPGWNEGGVYTLSPAYAWELADGGERG